MIKTLPDRLKTQSSLQINQTVYQTSAIIEKCRQLLTQQSENDVRLHQNTNVPSYNYYAMLNSQQRNQHEKASASIQKAQIQQNRKSIIHLRPKGKRQNDIKSKNKTKQDRFNHYISQLKSIEQQSQKVRSKNIQLKEQNKNIQKNSALQKNKSFFGNNLVTVAAKRSVKWNSSTIKKNDKQIKNRRNVSDLNQTNYNLFSSLNGQQLDFGVSLTNKKKQRQFTQHYQDCNRTLSPEFSQDHKNNRNTHVSKNQEGHTIKQYSKYGSFKMSNPFNSSQKSQQIKNQIEQMVAYSPKQEQQVNDNIITADFCRKKNKKYFSSKHQQDQWQASRQARNDSFEQTMLQLKRKKLQQEHNLLKMPIKKIKTGKKVQNFPSPRPDFNKTMASRSHLKYSFQDQKQKSRDRSQRKISNLNKSFESLSYSSKSKAKKSNAEKQKNEAIDKMKNYKFVERYMTDYQLQQLYNQYKMAGIPQFRWSMLIIDEVYKKIKINDSKNVSNKY